MPVVLAILENGIALVIPKFCAVRTVINIFIFSFALIDILVGVVVQSALLEKSSWFFFFFFFFFFSLQAEIVCEELSLTTLSLFASVLWYWLFSSSTLTAWKKLGLKQSSPQSGLCELFSFRYLKE